MKLFSGECRTGLVLFVFCLSFYLLTAGGHIYSTDNIIKLAVTESIVERHTVVLPSEIDHYIAVGRNGFNYSMFPIGMSLALIPVYLIGDQVAQWLPHFPREFILEFGYSLFNVFVTALLCVTLFFCGRKFNFSRRTSILLTLIYGFCTIAWPYAKMCWSEPLGTLLLFGGFFFLLRYRAHQRGWDALWAGVLAGAALTVRQEMVIYMPLFGLYLGYCVLQQERLWGKRLLPMALFAIAVFLFIGVDLGYNFLRFGSWFDFGPEGIMVKEGVAENNPPGYLEALVWQIYTNTFSSGKSFFFFSPPLILSVATFGHFYRRFRPEGLLLLSMVVVFLLFGARMYLVSSWAWGERFTVHLVPFLILPLGIWLENLEVGLWYRLRWVIALVLVGFLVQVVAVSTSFQRVFEEIIEKEGTIDFGKIRFDPEYSPLLLHTKKFWYSLSAIPNLQDQLAAQADQPNRLRTVVESTAWKNQVRSNSLDFWFLYMYFLDISLWWILVSLGGLVVCLYWSGRKLFQEILNESVTYPELQ